MRITSILVAIVGLTFTNPVLSEPLSFRGLHSSSVSADVKRVFPQARVQNYCRAGEMLSRSAEGETLCNQLAFDGYMLDNVLFDVTFMFNPDGTLRYVALLKMYGTFRTDEGSVSAGTINSNFTSLADLFSSKYGPAVTDSPRSFLKRGRVDNELEWQPGRGTKWQNGGDRISLTSSGTESKTSPGLFRGNVQIFYSFAKRDQFDQF